MRGHDPAMTRLYHQTTPLLMMMLADDAGEPYVELCDLLMALFFE